MKQIITTLFILSIFQLQAQDIDRSKAPEPGPAPIINIPDAASFVLSNGLKVFVVTNSKLPRVSATLTINRNAILEGSKAGIADMAGALLREGTTKMNKVTLDEEIDFLGGSVSSGPLSVSASSLTGNFSKIVGLMADVALRPSMPAAQLEKIRTQILSGLAANSEDPNAISGNISNVLLYGKKHPFGEVKTEKTVKSVTLSDVKKFYSSLWKPNIAYLVFVGDITEAQAKKLSTQYFGGWVKGVVPKEDYPVVKAPAKTYIAIVDRPSSVQSVINIVTPVQLQPGTPDAIPSSLMNTILGRGTRSRLTQNLREKYGFTYDARSTLSPNRVVGSFSAGTSVRNEKTDSAIGQLLLEIKRMSDEVVDANDVSAIKNYMSGGFARSMEDPSTIANFALNIARYQLPKDYYRKYLSTLALVTPANVRQMAEKYIGQPMIITVVGNAREIAPGLEKYGELKYFDIYGNETAAPITKTVDLNLKAEDILRKALNAYGSESDIAAIKDIQMNGGINMMGQKLDYVQKNILPGSFSNSVLMGGMALMNMEKKGNNYRSSIQGNELPLNEASKEEIDMKAALFTESYMLNHEGFVYKLKGMEQVDGKDAYVLDIVSPMGNKTTVFYDVNSGLKLQEQSEKEAGPMGLMKITTKILEYKMVENVKFPAKLVNDFGQFKQEVNIDSIKINQGLKESDL